VEVQCFTNATEYSGDRFLIRNNKKPNIKHFVLSACYSDKVPYLLKLFSQIKKSCIQLFLFIFIEQNCLLVQQEKQLPTMATESLILAPVCLSTI
jgi:hypothetical protein